jgi:hypothetical protein
MEPPAISGRPPHIFPNSRKPTQRPGSIGNARVRILSLQPSSPRQPVSCPVSLRKARNWRAFMQSSEVSRWRNWPRGPFNSRKSLANTGEIPVFGSQQAETGFDTHCRTGAAVACHKTSVRAGLDSRSEISISEGAISNYTLTLAAERRL